MKATYMNSDMIETPASGLLKSAVKNKRAPGKSLLWLKAGCREKSIGPTSPISRKKN